MEIIEGHILEFDHDYKPANHPPKEEGFYMTIRCGLGGIYYRFDEWREGNWQVGILDASYVIAYSRETIAREVVNECARKKLDNRKYAL